MYERQRSIFDPVLEAIFARTVQREENHGIGKGLYNINNLYVENEDGQLTNGFYYCGLCATIKLTGECECKGPGAGQEFLTPFDECSLRDRTTSSRLCGECVDNGYYGLPYPMYYTTPDGRYKVYSREAVKCCPMVEEIVIWGDKVFHKSCWKEEIKQCSVVGSDGSSERHVSHVLKSSKCEVCLKTWFRENQRNQLCLHCEVNRIMCSEVLTVEKIITTEDERLENLNKKINF